MNHRHHPLQLATQLRTIFDNSKIPIGFFLGAGCPSSINKTNGDGHVPLIDDVAGLTKSIAADLSSDPEIGPLYGRLVNNVARNDYEQPTVEDLLTHIRHAKVVVGNADVRGLKADDLQQLDAGICKAVSKRVAVRLPDDSPYHSVARFMKRKRDSSTVIFTTNYDLLTEQALESMQVPFFDGFVGSYCPFFDRDAIEHDEFPNRWVRLWKLHGSINWRLRGGHVYRVHPHSDDNATAGDDVLIHPSHLKYIDSQRMPYVAMFDRLKAYIHHENKPVAFFVVGYSFSDEHLNAALTESLQGNPVASCYAFLYENLDYYDRAIICAKRTDNLNLLAPDGAILSRRRGHWAHDNDKLLKIIFAPQSTSNDVTDAAAHNVDKSPTRNRMECRLGNFVVFGNYLDDLGMRQYDDYPDGDNQRIDHT